LRCQRADKFTSGLARTACGRGVRARRPGPTAASTRSGEEEPEEEVPPAAAVGVEVVAAACADVKLTRSPTLRGRSSSAY
jgi:hypothetical protein